MDGALARAGRAHGGTGISRSIPPTYTVDYNGWYPDGEFHFGTGTTGNNYPSFAAVQAGGLYEAHGRLLGASIFASGLVAPPSYKTAVTPGDGTLAPGSDAIDHGMAIANVTDGYHGVAPDLGAQETGCPVPIYGVRPEGVDESNEVSGCPGSAGSGDAGAGVGDAGVAGDGGGGTGTGADAGGGPGGDGGANGAQPGAKSGCGCRATGEGGGARRRSACGARVARPGRAASQEEAVRPPLAALALAVALVIACGPPPAAEAPSGGEGSAFAGCFGVFTSVLGWTFECDGTSVVTREGDDVEGLLRGARESMRGAFAGAVDERREEVRVGGAAHKGAVLSLRTARKQVVAVGTAAVLESEGTPRASSRASRARTTPRRRGAASSSTSSRRSRSRSCPRPACASARGRCPPSRGGRSSRRPTVA